MTKYTMVKKKVEPITLELAPTNIINSARYKYKCDTCSLRFKDYAALRDHRKEHKSIDDEDSPTSRETTPTTSDIESFSESTSSDEEEDDDDDDDDDQQKPKENSFQCKFCNRIFRYNYTYANHLKQHKHFVCVKCHKVHDSKEELEKHLQEDHKICPCKLCPQMFYSERNLESHLKQKHYKHGIVCVVCSVKFDTISELDEHSKEHSEDNTVCDLCNKKFNTESELEKHLSTHFSIVKVLHKNNKNETVEEANSLSTNKFKCTLCNKMFMTKEQLDSHLVKHIHLHNSAPTKEPQPTSQVTTTVTTTKSISTPVIVTRMNNQTMANVISKTVTPTIPITTVSNATAAPTVIKTVPGVPLLQNKQMIISSAASIPTTSNAGTHSLTLNPNQHKLLVMNDKKYLIVSESSPMSGNGLLKLVIADPNKPNTVLQAIPALQPISSIQPINNFLQPAINQTFVLPNPQISITNQTYSAGDLNQGTTNIVYTTPNGETIKPIKVTKTYSAKGRKIIGKLVKTTIAPSAVYPNAGTVVSSGGTITAPTLFLTPSSGSIVPSGGTMAPTALVVAPTSAVVAPPLATEPSTSATQPVETSEQVDTPESTSIAPVITNAAPDTPSSDADYKPKIFLKPLSQLLEKPGNDSETGERLLAEPTEVENPKDAASFVKSKRVYKCKQCPVICKRMGKLLQHQNKYKCKRCDFGCCKLKILDVHYSEEHDYKNRCVSCDTQFPTLSELQHHKKSVHLCKKCNRCYFDLNKHQTNYKCSNCDFYACGALGLDTHYKLVHRITTRCAPCNKIFYSNEAFQQHKQEIHFCDKCCTYKMDLNVHKTFCKGGPKASTSTSTSQPATSSPEVIELDSD